MRLKYLNKDSHKPKRIFTYHTLFLSFILIILFMGCVYLYPRWRRGARIQQPDTGRHGGRKCANPGPDGVPFFRRLEELAVRRYSYARAGRRALLHPPESDHVALAHRAPVGRRIYNADDEISRGKFSLT